MVLRPSRQTKRAAFTLMEIIVVVAIILILAGAGVFVFTSVLDDQHVNRAKLDVNSLQKAVEVWKVKYRDYPQSLQVLAEPGPNGEAALVKDEGLTDPWGQPYMYDPSQRHPKTHVPHIWSNGPPSHPQMIDNWGKL
jgi:general secretion pathway protein G